MRTPVILFALLMVFTGLARHILKLVEAAQTLVVKSALQEDQISFLRRTNNEAKVRRSTKSTVLGKATVMSFEALVEARAKRMEKEAAKAAKKKRTRKRGAATPEVCMSKTTAEAAQMIGAPRSATMPLQMTEIHDLEGATVPCSRRAPVARMR
jgi:uncharacterized protein YfaQ (DUF2300 family)